MTMNRKSLLAYISISLLCLQLGCKAQSSKSFPFADESKTGLSVPLPSMGSLLHGWTKEPWTADGKPYRAIAAEIKALDANNKLKDILSAVRSAAIRQPVNALVQYRWVLTELRLKYDQSKMWRFASAMAQCPSPRSLHFACLQFYVTAAYASETPSYLGNVDLKRAGDRLLAMRPNDTGVQYWMELIRAKTASIEDKYENIRHFQNKVKSFPQTATFQAQLACSYRDLWFVSRRAADANEAIKQFKKYLAIAGPNGDFRKGAVHWIESIQDDLKNPRITRK